MPRLLVSLILSLTALAGFLTSFLLLHAGVTAMWLRYPIAIWIAYVVFLLLLALWLSFQRRGRVPDTSVLDFMPDLPATEWESPQFGGGGDFAGGGAGGSWGNSVSPAAASEGGSHSFDFGLDLDELLLIVIGIVALLGGVIATFYIIYIAPALLAEILVDGVLVAGLYRRVKRVDRPHWLWAATRRTVVPAILVALFFALAGYAFHSAIPEAHTMVEVWNHVMRS